jgi:hypothetical protein
MILYCTVLTLCTSSRVQRYVRLRSLEAPESVPGEGTTNWIHARHGKCTTTGRGRKSKEGEDCKEGEAKEEWPRGREKEDEREKRDPSLP